MNYLWTVDKVSGYIVAPDGTLKMRVLNDDFLFARQLCNLLNNSASGYFYSTHEEMDLRGVPKL